MSGSENEACAFYGKPPLEPPAPAVDPFAGLRTPDPVVKPAEPAAASPAPAADPVLDAEDRAEGFYGHSVPTRGAVDWNEPAAQPAEYRLEAPLGVLDVSDEGKAAMERLRSGFAEAGAGQSIARELFADAVRAQQGSMMRTSKASAEAELRQQYGSRFDTRMGEARALIQRVAQRCPEVVSFLEGTGLGNDPAFIRKVVAASRRNRRSS